MIPGVPRSACRPVWSGTTAAVRGALLYFDGALADEPASARSHTDHPASNATNAVIVTRHRINNPPKVRGGSKTLKPFPKDTPTLLWTVQNLFNCLKHRQARGKPRLLKIFSPIILSRRRYTRTGFHERGWRRTRHAGSIHFVGLRLRPPRRLMPERPSGRLVDPLPGLGCPPHFW